MFSKVKLENLDISHKGEFYSIDKYSKRLKHSSQPVYENISTGMGVVNNASYDRDFLVFTANRFLIYDLNNFSLLKNKYGNDYWDESTRLTKNIIDKGFFDPKDPYVLIGGMVNYWHWINNFLPRVFLAKIFFGRDFRNVKFIFHKDLKEFQLEHLRLLGINGDQIVLSSLLEGVVFKKLYVPSFFGNFYYSPEVAESYRQYFKGNNFSRRSFFDVEKNRKIYLSRQRSRARKVFNQDELECVLKRHGFKTIYAEELSALEQFDVFNAADVIVSPHGAGLANLNFCNPGAKVFIFEYKRNASEMKTLSLANNLKPSVLTCKQMDNCSTETRLFDLVVPCEDLDKLLRQL